ncbi:MAG: DeoR family transcriptional regulator, partial [Nitrospira sp. CG24E]
WLTAKTLAGLGLNERQAQAVAYVRTHGRITNSEYQERLKVAKRTAHRDLGELVEKAVFVMVGKTGKGTYYILSKGATKGPKGPK